MPLEYTSGYLTALLLGITSGMSQCGAFCAPVVSTHIMGSKEGALEGLKSYIVFSAGRIFMCLLLGFGVSYAGTVTDINETIRYGSVIYTIILILIGCVMIVRPVRACSETNYKNRLRSFLSRHFLFSPTAHLFIMGTGLAIIPCPPMGAMLICSLQMPSILSGGFVMALFGIGTAVSPFLIICILAGWFSKKIKAEAPQYKMVFQRLSGIILILLGVFGAM